ncbi:unnamed protein product, partial [Nesidiocoris tenuis]
MGREVHLVLRGRAIIVGNEEGTRSIKAFLLPVELPAKYRPDIKASRYFSWTPFRMFRKGRVSYVSNSTTILYDACSIPATSYHVGIGKPQRWYLCRGYFSNSWIRPRHSGAEVKSSWLISIAGRTRKWSCSTSPSSQKQPFGRTDLQNGSHPIYQLAGVTERADYGGYAPCACRVHCSRTMLLILTCLYTLFSIKFV